MGVTYKGGKKYYHNQLTKKELSALKKKDKTLHEQLTKMIADANITPIDDTALPPQ